MAKSTKTVKFPIKEKVEEIAPSMFRRIDIQEDYYADVVAVHMNPMTTRLLLGQSLPREIDGRQVEVIEVQRSVSMNPMVAEDLYKALERSFAIRQAKEAEAAKAAVKEVPRTRPRNGK